MEKSNEIPDDYFFADHAYLPRTYENDVWLKNLIYCAVTGQYELPPIYLSEEYNCYSIFPSLATTRKYSDVWLNKGAEAPYRFRKITQDDRALLNEINKLAIFRPQK